MPRSHINERLHTSLANTGRAAGMGISYDRYDEGKRLSTTADKARQSAASI